jgi:hypothetical protein
VFLEGSLQRTLKPTILRSPSPLPSPAFDEPADDFVQTPPPVDAVLNPLSVYRKGEALLRDQLRALSPWHLVNILRAHELSDLPESALNVMSAPTLVELIVANTRIRLGETVPR